MNVGAVRLHLRDSCAEFVEEFLIRVQGQQVIFSEQEAKAVSFCPAQAVTRGSRHAGDGVLDVHHGTRLNWNIKYCKVNSAFPDLIN